MFSIIALEFFKLQPEENGYLMAFLGIVQMVTCARVQLTRVRSLCSYQRDPTICSGRPGTRDREDDCEVLRELAAASVRRGFCSGGAGSGTLTCTYGHVYKPRQPTAERESVYSIMEPLPL